jgi:hypothetical protein
MPGGVENQLGVLDLKVVGLSGSVGCGSYD